MSSDNSSYTFDELKREVVITPDECRSVLDFWEMFNIPVPKYMHDAINAFCKEPTWENQEKFKSAICRTIATSRHECVDNDLFRAIVEECGYIANSMQFHEEFEKLLSEE